MFSADVGGQPRTNVDVFIPITDDDVYEEYEQHFIAQLMVVEAVNMDLVEVNSHADCVILDNDRELSMSS